MASGRVLDIFNKADAMSAPSAAGDASIAPPGLLLSAKTGQGLEALRHALLKLAGWHENPEGVFTARARHVQALGRTDDHLQAARACLGAADPALELLAEELRLAQEALGEIVGKSTPDDLLGEIFSRFCIGK